MDLSFLFGGPTPEQQAAMRAQALRSQPTAGDMRAQLGIPDLSPAPMQGGDPYPPRFTNTGPPLLNIQPPTPKPGPEMTAGQAQQAMGMVPGPQAPPQGPQATQVPPGPQNAPPGPPGPPPGALPKARAMAVGQPVSTTTSTTTAAPTPPPEAVRPSDALQQRRGQYETELEALQQPADYTKLQEQAATRRAGGRNSLIMALAAQQAGKGFEPFAAQYLKQSAAMQGPTPIEGGMIDEQGQVVLDPAFQQQKKVEQAQRRIAAIDQQIAQAQSREEQLAYQRQRDAEMLEFRKQQAAFANLIAQGQLDAWREATAARLAAAGGGGAEGFDALPKTATAEEKNNYAHAALGVQVLPQLQKQIADNPEAFGVHAGVSERIGSMVGMSGSDIPFGKQLTPQQQATRGQVYQRYATLINQLIGAAQSPSEYARLQSFVLGQNESAESVARKMQGALQEAQNMRSNLRQRYGMAPELPAAPPAAPPAQAPAPAAQAGGRRATDQAPARSPADQALIDKYAPR